MTSVVPRLSGLRVTLYSRPNLYGHRALILSSMVSHERPKSSLTADAEPSVVDLPRNSQRELRAKPCWGSLATGGWSEVPKSCRAGAESA